MARNQYRSIIDLNSRLTNEIIEDCDTEVTKIYVSDVTHDLNGSVFLGLLHFGEQIAYAYLTQDEVADLIDALNHWRGNKDA